MIRWRSTSAYSACRRCQWSLNNHVRLRLDYHSSQRDVSPPKVTRRTRHATRAQPQSELVPKSSPDTFDPSLIGSSTTQLPIRDHLRRWDIENGGPDEAVLDVFENHPASENTGISNEMSQKLSSAKASDEPSDQSTTRDQEQDYSDVLTITLFLNPGDVVELAQSGREPVLAVFVKRLDHLCQFYTANGRWVHDLLSHISHVIPAGVDPDMLTPIIPYLPTKQLDPTMKPVDAIQIPPEVGAPVRAALHRLQDQSDAMYRENALILDKAYSTLAYPDRSRKMTAQQIAQALLGKNNSDWIPSARAVLAVRKALAHDHFRTPPDRTHSRMTQLYTFRPKNDVNEIEKVLEWVREYKEHQTPTSIRESHTKITATKGAQNISSFIAKARRLISTSRKYRDPHLGYIGPSNNASQSSVVSAHPTITWGEEFTETDKMIIKMLNAWVLNLAFNQMAEYHSACSSILNAVDKYSPQQMQTVASDAEIVMDGSTGHLFLQEIGVTSPHINRKLYEEHVGMPMSGVSHNVQLLEAKSELALRNPNFVDSMADFRENWSSMPIWCIDDADAKEIDDGISIEKVEGKDPGYWIHVHVANPTAFFTKTHVLSGLAAHRVQSVYTPSVNFPMLPSWLPQDYFSLQNNRPTIIFSCRIDMSGNILDKKVQHGIVRNVKSITYRELSEYLGESDLFAAENPFHLLVGGKLPGKSRRPLPPRSDQELENIRDLYSAAKVLWTARVAAGAFALDRSAERSNQIQVFQTPQTPGLAELPPSMDKARFLHGDPIINVTADLTGAKLASSITSRQIVEEMMVLACSVAGSWCGDRGIPCYYRGTIEQSAPGPVATMEQIQRQLIYPQVEELGYISPPAFRLLYEQIGRSIAHHAPMKHNALAVEAYTKVTSPLRRFTDMMGHWQIEAAIRWEARTGRKLDSSVTNNPSDSPLPFSRRQVQDSFYTVLPRETSIRNVQRSSGHLWSLQAFMRALHFGEAALPETLKVWVSFKTVGVTHGVIPGLDIGVVLLPKDADAVQTGDQWECKIVTANAYERRLAFEPVRLLYRQPQLNIDSV
ncbi:unnamed protein product [Periconia digitata]|uniref:RNB domain-containing protein n=1 Tax=Periconia digitata TaxID=1303443 RepID=A0A9W4XVL1_9PLEO|nr:unnamed protein product [Periconia digitata]